MTAPFVEYLEAGLSVIPIRADGSKAPSIPAWLEYQSRRPTVEEAERWAQRFEGIAVLGGEVSGNLEVIDVDEPALVRPFLESVRALDATLYDRLCLIRTPRRNASGQSGCHVLCRIDGAVTGNTKLAMSEPEPVIDANGKPVIDPSTGQGKTAPRTLIETRGQGGYVVTVGSSARCHPTGNLYEHVHGPALTDLEVITAAERQTMHQVARTFDRSIAETHVDPPIRGYERSRPGDSSFYKDWYVPTRLADASPATRITFELAIRGWVRFTGDPPLGEITVATLAKFRDCLTNLARYNRPGKLSPHTVAGRLRHIQILLGKAGPPGPRNRDAAGILPGPIPWVKPPRATLPPPKIVSLPRLSAVYEAADTMTGPVNLPVDVPAWWRAFLVVAYNTGLRRRTLFELRWEWIKWDDCLVCIPPQSMKSGRWHVIHLNPTAIDHLRAIRTERKLVFPWPAGPRYFDTLFNRLQHAAGVPVKERFGLHNIRKTVATQLWADSPQASQLALGHAGSAVTMNHYVQSEGIVAKALDRLPQPAAFRVAAAMRWRGRRSDCGTKMRLCPHLLNGPPARSPPCSTRSNGFCRRLPPAGCKTWTPKRSPGSKPSYATGSGRRTRFLPTWHTCEAPCNGRPIWD